MGDCIKDYAVNEPGEHDRVLTKVDGVWKYMDAGATKESGGWVRTKRQYIKDDGVWKQSFDYCKCNTRGYCTCENVFGCACEGVTSCTCNSNCTCNNRGCVCRIYAATDYLQYCPTPVCDCKYRSGCTCYNRCCTCMERVAGRCESVNVGCDCHTNSSYSTCSCNSQTSCPCNVYTGCNCESRGTI